MFEANDTRHYNLTKDFFESLGKRRKKNKTKQIGERGDPVGSLRRGNDGGRSAALSAPQPTSRLASLIDFLCRLTPSLCQALR